MKSWGVIIAGAGFLASACGGNSVSNSNSSPTPDPYGAQIAELQASLADAEARIDDLEASLDALSTPGTINQEDNPIDYTNIKGVPDFIYCEFFDANMTPANQGNVHLWTAGECGGALPDDNYVGAMTSVEICGAEDNFVVFTDDGMSNGPGMYWFSANPCAGVNIAALYIPKLAITTQ